MHGFVLIGAWVVLAFVLTVFPSNDQHWRRAYVLIGIGVPLLLWVTWQDGIWIGLLGLIVGASVLRWPVYYLWRRVQRLLGKG
jgi:hypothetical protein